MTIDRVRVYTQNGETQDFVTPAPKTDDIAPHKFQEGDLVRNTSRFAPGRGAIGVVRCTGGIGVIGNQVGVEWAGWREGHNLNGKARHHPRSGWFVPPESIEYAT